MKIRFLFIILTIQNLVFALGFLQRLKDLLVPSTLKCLNGYRIRKEFRDLSLSEWNLFKDTLDKARHITLDSTSNDTIYDSWVRIHIKAARRAHNSPQFLPWHRAFLDLVERDLSFIANQTIAIPYWDWSYDAAKPLESILFTAQYLGVRVGPKGDCRYPCKVPRPHCLIRNYNESFFETVFADSFSLDVMAKSTTKNFRRFSEILEAFPHSIVHLSLSGIGGDLYYMYSVNDPIFFLHHSFIDKIWWDWQISHRGNTFAYNGKHNGRKVRKSDSLLPFETKLKVGQILDLENTFCVKYQRFSLLDPNPHNRTSGIVKRGSIQEIPENYIKEMHGNVSQFRAAEYDFRNIVLSAKTIESSEANENYQVYSYLTVLFVILIHINNKTLF